jgi:predicted glycoside hydrolase/deacetylase ChbG (UPF0249 family)
MPERRRVTLCADDFALDAAATEGILRLVAKGRLSAVSCFADAPDWPAAGAELERRRGHVALGLHFNLTEPFGFAERPLAWWMAASFARRVDRAAVRAAAARQIDAFRRVTGAAPDFIDGHQHVHAFPVIRAIVAEAADQAGGGRPIPLRDVRVFFGRTDAPFKRFVIRSLARLGPPAGSYLNDAMAGDYSFSAAADYGALFAGWLAAAPERALIMCHPSAPRADAAPARTDARRAGPRELAFFESEAFGDLAERYGIGLAPD